MSDTIDNAASAFLTDMGGGSPKSSSRGPSETSGKPEILFDEPGGLDNPDEEAGGDSKPLRARKEDIESDDEFVEPNDDLEDEEKESDEDDLEDEEKESDEDDSDELMSKEFEVVVDGQEVKVPLREALDGYIRQKTFDQRMNIVAEAANEIRAEAESVAAKREATIAAYDEAIAIMAEVMPPPPDWDKLFEEDPAKARALQKNYETFQSKIAEVRGKRNDAAKAAQEQTEREEAEFARAEYPKFAAAAKWRDAKERSKDLDSMRRTALSVGYTEEEIGRIFDSRALIILRKASKYDRMVNSAKPTPVQRNGKPSSNPGAGSNRAAPKGMNGAQRQLSRTGSVHDAIPVFQDILRGKKR